MKWNWVVFYFEFLNCFLFYSVIFSQITIHSSYLCLLWPAGSSPVAYMEDIHHWLTRKIILIHFLSAKKKKIHHKVLFSFHVLFPSCWVLLRIPIPHLNRDVFWPWLLREIIILSERSPVDFSQLFLFIWLKYCCCWFWFHNHSFFFWQSYINL